MNEVTSWLGIRTRGIILQSILWLRRILRGSALKRKVALEVKK